ncbi:MAG: hypothetical protein SFV17_14675 [Candidatus Obscuribacter sp.]|nr:hypothetical protein [Candidatus Obscuribacter sp.]
MRAKGIRIMTSQSLFNASMKWLLYASFSLITTYAGICESAALENEEILTCSFVAILANPGSIDGQIVNTEGFLTTEDNEALWLSEADFEQKRRYNAVRLCFTGKTKFMINGKAVKPTLLECHGRSVTIEGRYTRKDVSVLEPFPSGRINVERMVVFSPPR